MAVIDFRQIDARFKARFPRAYPWIWFVALYLVSMTAMMIFAYGLRWMIRGG